MTVLKSGGLTRLLPAAGFVPVGWCQGSGVFGQHAGQAGEHIGEVFLGVDAQTWTGAGVTADWSDATNWSLATPLNNSTAAIIFGAGQQPAPNVDTAWAVQSIEFNAFAGPYLVTGAALTIGSGGIANNDATDTQTFQNIITLAAPQTRNAQAGGFVFNGAITQAANNLTLSDPSFFDFNASRSGTDSFIIREHRSLRLGLQQSPRRE